MSESCYPRDCSPPGSSVCRILQARILEWVAISFSKGHSQSRESSPGLLYCSRFFTSWAMREAPFITTLFLFWKVPSLVSALQLVEPDPPTLGFTKLAGCFPVADTQRSSPKLSLPLPGHSTTKWIKEYNDQLSFFLLQRAFKSWGSQPWLYNRLSRNFPGLFAFYISLSNIYCLQPLSFEKAICYAAVGN